MRRLARIFVAAAALVLGVGMMAEAQNYPPDFILTADPSTVPPGGNVTATVQGCTSGATVNFDLEGSTASDTCADGSSGNPTASGDVTAPATPGTYTLTATQPPDFTATAQVTVTAGEARPLPSTGSNSTHANLYIAGALLAMGLAAFAVSQFRRRQPGAA
jgi:LPXTG-motif cell wall-anchored protein